jgi:hypothetical protein
MPEQQFYSSTSWQAPFAVTAVTFYVTGGGGGGYRDNDGPGTNGNGGGGGSGGYLIGSVGVTPGGVYSVQVGGGGAIGYYSRGGAGGTSSFAGYQATGGQPGRDGSGGNGGSPNGVSGEEDAGQNTSARGRGGTSLDSPYGNGGNGNRNDNDNATAGNAGRVRIVYNYNPPTITSFTVGDQYSNGGTPRDDVFISWSTTFANSVSISNYGSGLGPSGSNSSFNTGLQSVAGGNSPATRTYTLTASGPGGTVTATATANVYNDNTPSNTWTTTFTNLEPSTQYAKRLGTLSGIDMPTRISSPNSGVFFANGANGSYANPQIFTNGQNVYIKMITLPFNTDVSGVTGDFGKTNTKTVSVTAGGLSAFNVSYVTRKPRISEDFNYDGQVGYPFEDIDLIDNTPIPSTLVTQTLNMDDIEIDMEIKADNPDLEIKINNGSWQSIREI